MNHTISNTKSNYKKCQLCQYEIWNKSSSILFEKKCDCHFHCHDACFLNWVNEFEMCLHCLSKVNVIYKPNFEKDDNTSDFTPRFSVERREQNIRNVFSKIIDFFFH
jgi:hypothetical protein